MNHSGFRKCGDWFKPVRAHTGDLGKAVDVTEGNAQLKVSWITQKKGSDVNCINLSFLVFEFP